MDIYRTASTSGVWTLSNFLSVEMNSLLFDQKSLTTLGQTVRQPTNHHYVSSFDLYEKSRATKNPSNTLGGT